MAYFNGRQILLAGLKGKDGITPHIGENGNWFIGDKDTGVSASGGTFGGGTADIPEYDLTSLGTIEVDGDPIEVEMDTTQVLSDLENGHVKIKMNVLMSGESVPVTNIDKAMMMANGTRTIAVVTDVTSFMGEIIITDIMVMPGVVAIWAYSLSRWVTSLIDSYMESAIGGEY